MPYIKHLNYVFSAGALCTFGYVLHKYTKIEYFSKLYRLEHLHLSKSAEAHYNTLKRYGFPSNENIRAYTSFVTSLNFATRNPNWVGEVLEKRTKTDERDRNQCQFKEDSSVDPIFRVYPKIYSNSGYDRGHMAPAADSITQSSMCESFTMGNICPQNPDLNRNYWSRLESMIRKMSHVVVFTGPLYLPTKFEKNKKYVCYEVLNTNPPVAVPTHFFKIILCELKNNENNKVERVLASYIIPNTSIPPNTPLLPLCKVEEASGFLFFPNLVKSKLIDPNVLPPERQLPPPRF